MSTPVQSLLSLQAFLAFLPVVITCTTAVLVMLAIAFKRHHSFNATVSVVGLNAALLSVWWVATYIAPQPATALFVVDGFACFYMALILAATLACITLAYAYMEGHPGNKEELYLLLVLAATGALVLVCARHMVGLFLGIEILSVPLFGLAAYSFQRSRSLEAGIKYLVLSVVSSAFLLLGIALLYAQTGALSYAGIQEAVVANMMANTAAGSPVPLLVVAGSALILMALAFKLSLVPFHLWTPDVYEGAPVPVTAFLATVSKVAVFAAFVRLLQEMPFFASGGMHAALMAMAALSILLGNWLALMQKNIKRLLAYSSIAHFGYLLVIVVVGTKLGQEAVAVYLLTYVITSLAAFGVLVLASSPYKGADADALHNYRGLFWARPYLTAVMTVAMLSLAGIPLTAGFIGKLYVMLMGVSAGLWWLLAVVVVGSAMGLYYYLRVMVTLYLVESGRRAFDAPLNWARTAGGAVLLLVSVTMLAVGMYPQPVMQFIQGLMLGG